MIFLIIIWPNFVYYWLIPDFIPPLKFLWSFAVSFPPVGWTPLADTTDKETNERTDGRRKRRVSSSVRLLDGVWHCAVNNVSLLVNITFLSLVSFLWRIKVCVVLWQIHRWLTFVERRPRTLTSTVLTSSLPTFRSAIPPAATVRVACTRFLETDSSP